VHYDRRVLRPARVVILGLVALAAAPARADRVRVDIEGLGGPERNNASLVLSIAAAARDKADLPESRVRQLHEQAAGEIARALEPFGYYRPVVDGTLEKDGDTWRATYRVDAGPPLELEAVEVRVDGPGADEFADLRSAFPLHTGDTLDHTAYDSGKQAFSDRAAASGYLDAEFDAARIEIDLERYVSRIVLHFETGPRYRFGKVSFNQDVLEPGLLQEFVPFEPGDPFDTGKLLEFQGALAESPYFRRVEVLAQEDRATNRRVPIDVNLVPSARQRWAVGAGYGTDTGPRGTVDLELRRINRRGHRGEANLVLSGIERSIATKYLVPTGNPRTDQIVYTAAFAVLRPETSKSDTALVGATLARARGKWRESFGLTFQREQFEVGVDSGTSVLLMPEAGWSRVVADDRIFPLRGRMLELRLRGAADSILSETSFAQARVEARWFRGLGGNVRAHARVAVGYMNASDFRRLPASLRFFAGGDRSVRGFGYQELGPRDDEGHVIGGEALLTASLEMDYLFLEKFGRWGVAAFYDAGNAMTSLSGHLERGAGAGIRWLSPIGLVRADVAWPVSQHGGSPRLHLTVGPDL